MKIYCHDHEGNECSFSYEGAELNCSHKGLLALPARIDPHVHFRTPGNEEKENWLSGARAAFKGGCFFVGDMPNTNPPCIDGDSLREKVKLVQRQIKDSSLPLEAKFYVGLTKEKLSSLPSILPFREHIAGLKIFMGSSTGSLLVDDTETLEKAFSFAAANDLLIAVHAEDEALIREREKLYPLGIDPSRHSVVRNDEVARRAVIRALDLAKRFSVRLFILHVSTKKELLCIKQAKEQGVEVFAEVCPHHLFLSTEDYQRLGCKALVNPPLRDKIEQKYLWKAIKEGIVETLGSDHAPHLEKEKTLPYGKAPSGMSGVEWAYPLLFHAYKEGKIDLSDLVRLTSEGPRRVLRLPKKEHYAIFDPNENYTISFPMETKAQWSSYEGMECKGKLIALVLEGKVFPLVERKKEALV